MAIRFRKEILAWATVMALVVFLHSSSAPVWSQSPVAVSSDPLVSIQPLPFDRGSSGLWQILQKLHTRASMLMVTAHPDDEDGGMLTYESRGVGARVALLTLNRGEGGANVMSSDYFDSLGLVRTQELLQADRYYGVQQFFTPVTDYGFSKTKEECLNKWGHDKVLASVVRVVRMTRPLVVTSVFVGGRTDGHGNHQVAGQMAQEAFKAAGDPNMFPEQLKEGLRPWKPIKDYARVPFAMITEKGIYDYADGKYYPAEFQNYISGAIEKGQLPAAVEVPSGSYNPLLGLTYAQVATLGLGYQKSQNGGTGLPPAEEDMASYHRFASLVSVPDKEDSVFDGIDVSLPAIAQLAPEGNNSFLKEGLANINGIVEKAIAEYSAQKPEAIAPTLSAGLRATQELIDRVAASGFSADAKYDVTHELKVKEVQFENALAESLGVSILSTVGPDQEPTGPWARFFRNPETFQVAIPGQKFHVKIHVLNQSNVALRVDDVKFQTAREESWQIQPEGEVTGPLTANQARDLRFGVSVPMNAGATRPYFSRPDIEQASYDVNKPQFTSQPFAPYPLVARVQLSYGGVPFEIAQVVQSVKRVTGPGNVLQPLIVAPAIGVSITPRSGVIPLNSRSFDVAVTVHSNVKGPAKGVVKLELPSGWQAPPQEFSTGKDGEDQSLRFRVSTNQIEEKPYTITAVASFAGQDYKEGYHTASYSGLNPYNLYQTSTSRTTGADVKVAPGLNIGYVVGAGDDVPQSLASLGVQVHFLSPEDMANSDLSKLDAIVLGVRTYAVRQDLKTYNSRILDYVKNGGVLIVEYNTPEYDQNYGPYPYKMGENPEEVTDENSKMQILEPSNPIFTWPNQITSKDFDNWVEERGSKFLSSWDSHYQALLETHDPGQEPQKGGLLYAQYGRGFYIYCAYALYRQMPEGVPGSYRLFANMLSLGKSPAAQIGNPTAGTRGKEKK